MGSIERWTRRVWHSLVRVQPNGERANALNAVGSVSGSSGSLDSIDRREFASTTIFHLNLGSLFRFRPSIL